MSHTHHDKSGLMGLVRRNRGQIEALERRRESGQEFAEILRQIAAVRGAATACEPLAADTGAVLLDRELEHPVVEKVRKAVEADAGAGGARITDLHVWHVGQRAYACAMTAVAPGRAPTADRVRERLPVPEETVPSTIALHRCGDASRAAAQGAAASMPGAPTQAAHA